MIVFFALSFLLASPVIESELLLSSSNSTISLINSNESSLGMLSSDTTAAAEIEAFGRGVLVKSTGKVELILTDRTLKIKADVAEHCIGHIQICFPYSDDEDSLAKNLCNPGFCAFNINNDIRDVNYIVARGGHKSCSDPIHMKKGQKTHYCGSMDWGCDPLMDGNGKIAIEVTYMTYTCSVFIDNAKIAPPKPTPSVPLIAGPSSAETANASTPPWYLWVILALIILFIVALIVGMIVCYIVKIGFFKTSGVLNDDVFMDYHHNARIVPKSMIVKKEMEKSKVAVAGVKAKKVDKKQKKAAKKEKSQTLEVKTPTSYEETPPPPPPHAPPSRKPQKKKRRSLDQDTRQNSTEEI